VRPPGAVEPIPWATLVTIAEAIGYDPTDVVVITMTRDLVEVEVASGWIARHPVTHPPTPPTEVSGDPPES
jgi:hypothetical protein